MIIRALLVKYEGELGVMQLKNGAKVKMPRSLLPSEAKEGDIIKIRIDKNATSKQRFAEEWLS